MAFNKTKPIKNISNCIHYWRGEPKVGKALANGTEVFTPHGLKKIEELIVGDEISNTYGGRSVVEGVFPQGFRKVAKIKFSNGRTEVADWEHKWSVFGLDEEDNTPVPIVDTTKEIAERMAEGRVFSLPGIAPLDMEPRPLPYDPMELGMMLFDDNAIGDFEKEIIKAVCGKHLRLPQEYLFNSFKNRLEFVGGVLYNAKSVSEDQCLLSVKLKANQRNLAQDVIWMANSIGWHAYVEDDNLVIKPTLQQYPMFAVEYFLNVLPNQAIDSFLEHSVLQYEPVLIEEITPLEEEVECTCIKVSSIDSLFITSNFIPTHNTTLFRDLVLHENDGDYEKGLLVSFGDEKGFLSIEDLQYEEILEWDKEEDENGDRGFVQLVDFIVENNDELGLNLIAFDTLDKMADVVEAWVVKVAEKEAKKPIKSINEAFGGFYRGQNYAKEEIQRQVARLQAVGLNPIVIAHTKTREKEDPFTGEVFSRYEAKAPDIYNGIFDTSAQVTMTITKDREIENGVITSVENIMHFRDNGVVDAGSRFSEMPEGLELSVENYVKAFNMGVESTYRKDKNEEDKPKPVDKLKENADKVITKIDELIVEGKLTKADVTSVLKENDLTAVSKVRNLTELKKITKEIMAKVKDE